MLVISNFQLKAFNNIILNIIIFHLFKNIFTKHLCLKYARNRLSINIVACNSFHSNRHQKEHFSLWSMSLLRKIGYRFAWNGSGYKKYQLLLQVVSILLSHSPSAKIVFVVWPSRPFVHLYPTLRSDSRHRCIHLLKMKISYDTNLPTICLCRIISYKTYHFYRIRKINTLIADPLFYISGLAYNSLKICSDLLAIDSIAEFLSFDQFLLLLWILPSSATND